MALLFVLPLLLLPLPLLLFLLLLRFSRRCDPDLSSSSSSSSSTSSSSSSSSSSSRHWRFDVFPSFSGADVRRTFLSHFHKEFQRKGIEIFKDDAIKRGQTIGSELVQAIRESRISIVVLSKNYASSSWCLNELLEIVKCRETARQTVMTVFHNVDPSDVRKQTGDFGKAFEKTCIGKTEEEKQIWRQALKAIAEIAGEHSANWNDESKMIEKIAIDVLNKLAYSTHSRDFDHLVGIEAHMAKIDSLLCQKTDEVRIVGIWGPAGIGKTTIARVLSNQLSNNFQLSCFMENIGGRFKETDLDVYGFKLHLQERFLSKLLDKEDLKIPHLGVARERLMYQKVLVVLDGVDELQHLEALADDIEWFGPGSRIIVTTKDKNLLSAHKVNYVYEMNFPSKDEALQMFCQYAFKQNSPLDGFQDLADEVTSLAGRLPLGLNVLGSYLRGKNKDDWELALPRLRDTLDGRIEKVLKVGYDGLSQKDQAIFRHIACLFNGIHIDRLTRLLADSRLDVSHGLLVLVQKSLIQISINGLVVMHNLLQKMGRKVVHDQSPNESGKREFLVDPEDICDVLTDTPGATAVLGISLDISDIDIDECLISEKAFEGMRNLRFLKLSSDNVLCLSPTGDASKLHLPRGLDYLPRKLRLLHWDTYPMKNLPSGFCPGFLIELIMRGSTLEKLWEGIQPFGSLKKMDLSGSMGLKEIPDLSKATKLETLYLNYCESLVALPSSIQHLSKLTELDMSYCEKLEDLPTNINLDSLLRLILAGCSRLKTFPEISCKIVDLFLGHTAIEEVPSWIENLFRLRTLTMNDCKNLKNISSSISKLEHLEELYFLRCSNLESIPDGFRCLSRLRKLYLSNCRKLISLPELPSSLSWLWAYGCESLERISGSFHNPEMFLKFTNCFQLNQEAQELIQQSVCRYACLPSKELPTYVTHRASGNSLTIHLDKRPISGSLAFKPCLVFAFSPGTCGWDPIRIACHIMCKHGDNILLKKWYFEPFPPLTDEAPKSDNLIVFDPCYWPNEDDDLEAELSHNEILLKFSCTSPTYCEIKEWGVQLSSPALVRREDESNTNSDGGDSDVENSMDGNGDR